MQIQTNKNSPLDMDKWRDIVEAWKNSGENQKAYCQRLEISLNTFCYARSKLLEQDKAKPHFIPLAIKSNSEEKISSSSSIILENPRGYKMHFSASLFLEQLAKIFKLSGWNNA